MLKKTVLVGSLVATIGATSTIAHSSYFKSGFLAGGQVGVGFGNGKFNGAFATPVAATDTQNGSARKTGPLFGLLAGYRHVFNQDYTIGFILEANIFGSNELNKQLTHFNNVFPINNKLKKNFNIIPTITLGKIFCGRWNASLGLGLAIARFRQSINIAAPGLSGSSSASQTKVGFVPSIGVEYATTPNVSLFGNVSYEIYNNVSKKFTNNNLGAGSTYTTSLKPRYLTLKVGAFYRF